MKRKKVSKGKGRRGGDGGRKNVESESTRHKKGGMVKPVNGPGRGQANSHQLLDRHYLSTALSNF